MLETRVSCIPTPGSCHIPHPGVGMSDTRVSDNLFITIFKRPFAASLFPVFIDSGQSFRISELIVIFASTHPYSSLKEKQRMDSPEISEKLIEQLSHGSIKAFDKIYHTYYVYLCAIAVYYVHDKRVAGEIVNDVFVSFWQNRRHITYPALPYLRRAIQNASISYLRSSYFNERMMTAQMEEAWTFLENHILSSDNPLQALENSEMNGMIAQKVEELPVKCRAIFKASLYEGKSYSEIAEEQNINVATVRVQMKIALTKLRESLGAPYMIAILMFL